MSTVRDSALQVIVQTIQRKAGKERSQCVLPLGDVSQDASTCTIETEKRIGLGEGQVGSETKIVRRDRMTSNKCLEKAYSGELEGRDTRVTAQYVSQAIDLSVRVMKDIYARVFASTVGYEAAT